MKLMYQCILASDSEGGLKRVVHWIPEPYAKVGSCFTINGKTHWILTVDPSPLTEHQVQALRGRE